MNATPTNLENPAVFLSHRILFEEGVECSLLALAPNEQTSCYGMPPTHDYVIFVIDGHLNVQLGEVTCLLRKDEALRIPAGQENTITNGADGWTKLLRVAIPRREPEAPVLYAFPPEA